MKPDMTVIAQPDKPEHTTFQSSSKMKTLEELPFIKIELQFGKHN